MKSSEQNLPAAEKTLQKEATSGVPPQGSIKTRVATRKEKGEEKQVDTEHKEKKSKIENVPPPVAKKRFFLKPVPAVTVEVVEELAIGSSPIAKKGKSRRS